MLRRTRKRRTSRPMSKLPEKWTRYKTIGSQIEGTRFVPFKTPLDEHYFEGDPCSSNDRLTVDLLANQIKEAHLNVGLVIDLTTSFKYYDPVGWKKHDIEYKKLRCDGSHLMERRAEFNKIVEEYIHKEPDKLIGVHCVHGLNRTGFLICAYMVEHMGCQMKKAIAAFENARGHTIETSRGKLIELEELLHSNTSSLSD